MKYYVAHCDAWLGEIADSREKALELTSRACGFTEGLVVDEADPDLARAMLDGDEIRAWTGGHGYPLEIDRDRI